ncbi:MAG: hypothetical protein ACI9KE_001513 [Polyangiales bacterium]|jgi:hypothetical protein
MAWFALREFTHSASVNDDIRGLLATDVVVDRMARSFSVRSKDLLRTTAEVFAVPFCAGPRG